MAATITITVGDDGRLNINGPPEILGNKLLSFGILELAKDAVRLIGTQQQSPILQAKEMPRIIPLVPPKNGG